MLTSLMLIAAVTAVTSETTAADVGRCVYAKAQQLSASSDHTELAAEKAVEACSTLIEQYSAARDALVTRDAGYAPPSANSAEWKASVTSAMKESASRTINMARNTR